MDLFFAALALGFGVLLWALIVLCGRLMEVKP